jgi:hypothetical protein
MSQSSDMLWLSSSSTAIRHNTVGFTKRLVHAIFHIGPDINPWLPHLAQQRNWRADMSRGLILGTIWKISCHILLITYFTRCPDGSMSLVVGLPNNSYKPITNTVWVRARLCKLQKRYTRLAVAKDKVYQLLAHSRWFSSDTPTSSTTKTGRRDIVETQ